MDAKRLVWKLLLCSTHTVFTYIICLFGAAEGNVGIDNGGGGGEAKGELSLNVYITLKRNFGFPVSFEPHTYSFVPFPIVQEN